ncbi:probable E3 ubiquitin-protein ligase RNF144A [Daphnia pulex]|uniref:probable E3 ubiquitin-protein ligase RNF144A n=1 Tax=Daphnia pulex TaxID=6669 RepID=UPI001EE056E8|nr:probable E3 ubiquitin-protein ligase RNF144A [Daphnia pulex]
MSNKMPGLNKIIGHHQSLNSSKTEKSEKWHWPGWLKKRKPARSSNQLVPNVSNVVPREYEEGMPSHSQGGLVINQQSQDQMETMEDILQDDLVCLLCLQVPNEWFTLESCGCRFCQQCMEMYAHCSIRSGNVPISCPDAHCSLNEQGKNKQGGSSQLTRNEVRQLVPSDVFPLYLRLQLNTEVAVDPRLMWCPRPGCETVCTLTEEVSHKKTKRKFFGLLPISRNQRNQAVVCSSCQFSFCSQCKTPWHIDSPCPSLSRLLSDPNKNVHDPDDPIVLLERDGHIKRCPFCQVPIERDDGCAQMMCKNCRHVFCWFCLASLDDDFMLRHYDSGPCRSRLGHSRISVVWHRTQVVSAFLGLGVLFLVTSPLLLLASPCFFCWRHHAQQKESSIVRSNVDSTTANFVPSSSQEHL